MFIHSVYSKQYSECGSQLNLSEPCSYRKYRIATYRECSNIRVTPCVKTLHRQDRPLPTDRCPPPPQPNTGTCLPSKVLKALRPRAVCLPSRPLHWAMVWFQAVWRLSKLLLMCSRLPGMASRSWSRGRPDPGHRSRACCGLARVFPQRVHDREPSHGPKNPVHLAKRRKAKLNPDEGRPRQG
jgi:hypothetical protein